VPSLLFEGVTAGYGDRSAIDGVSLSVRSGEIVGLVGPNGSGKTTLVRVASRALRPSEGWVRVAGHDPYRIPAREAARLVAVVPQDVQPAFSFTVLEVVLMGRAPYASAWGGGSAEDWSRVRQAMARTEVQHLADRPIDELSGGERRRVILAQALAQDAPVLLLDEPTTHLDLGHVLELLRIVRDLAVRRGVAVLAILHDLSLAGASCDRLIALHDGRVVADGPPEVVVTPELLRTVWGVEADVAIDPATGRPAVRLGPPDAAPPRLGRRAHVVGGAGRGAPLYRALAEAGYEVSAGVLHAADSDALAAERLNLLRVSVPAFSTIDRESAEEGLVHMRASDLLVVCDAPFGPGNIENLRLALAAARAGVRTVLLEQIPIGDRDFTGGEATELWLSLRGVAEVAAGYDEVLVAAG
jgi:iron complex transport system ATP-binding protein